MKRGIIEPLGMTFTEAIKRVVKAADRPEKIKKKRPAGQTKSPPVTAGASPPGSS